MPEPLERVVQLRTQAAPAPATAPPPGTRSTDFPEPAETPTGTDKGSATQAHSSKAESRSKNTAPAHIAPGKESTAPKGVAGSVATANRNPATDSQQGVKPSHSVRLLVDNQPTLTETGTAAPPTFDSTEDGVAPEPKAMAQASLPPLVAGYKTTQPGPQQAMAELPAVSEQLVREQPTIHINIGRVEVRAQTTGPRPTPQASRPKPQSSLSLNDYLKRGGGQS